MLDSVTRFYKCVSLWLNFKVFAILRYIFVFKILNLIWKLFNMQFGQIFIYLNCQILNKKPGHLVTLLLD